MNRGIFRLLSQYKSVPSELYECYQEYSDGLEQINLNSPITAEAKFKECIEILKLKNALGGPGHNFILKRLALVQRTKKAYKDCEESLETIVENCESTESPDLVPAAIDLMKQCLNTNLAKAREYGEVLQTMDLNELKNEFQFLFGTALVMNSEFVEGKKFLTESFEGDDGKNKGIILHNLACAGWWHIEKFNGIDESYLIEEIKKELQQSVKDYKESIPNFKKSIMIINGLKEEYNIDKNVLEMPNSVLSILNIGEIYLQNAIFEQALKWLKKGIEIQIMFDKDQTGRGLTLLGVAMKFMNDLEKAEEVFKRAGIILKGRNDFSEFFFLQIYGNMLLNSKRVEEGETLINKSKEILKEVPIWAEKSTQLFLPTWHL